jgi:hypothetical protein
MKGTLKTGDLTLKMKDVNSSKRIYKQQISTCEVLFKKRSPSY